MGNPGRYGSPTPTPPPTAGTVVAGNPPSGLRVGQVSSTTVALSWNRCANATGYTIYAQQGSVPAGVTQVPASQLGVTVGSLAAATTYKFTVQATPAKAGGPVATTSATTSR
jgi:hypothetical protein